MVEHVIEAGVAIIPGLARIRVLRSWGGIADMSMDGSPIVEKIHIDKLYLNAGVLRRLQGLAGRAVVLRPHHRQCY
jgi:glycine/D-amino acid oxidase-like deaminating enzyme